MIDPIEAVRKFLQSQDALISATTKDHDHGIYRANPRGIKGQIAPKCVVIQAAGGESREYPYVVAKLYVRAYGEADAAAMEVYRRVWDAFRNADGSARGPIRILNRWLMHYADLSQPIAATESTGWSVVISTLTAAFDPVHDGLGG